ncbi:MAG TPA: recombinase family protein [Hyphomicrobiaceae bacterium]
MKIGYARVSTEDQNLALQRQALKRAECERIYEDKGISGAAINRPALKRALKAAKPGDVLVVWKLDRLGRDLRHLVNLAHELTTKGVGLKVLEGQGAEIDTTTANGRLIFGIFAALAEFERELISERTRAGMAAAKRDGKHVGRPRKLTDAQIEEARAAVASGQARKAVAARLGVDAITLRRALSGSGTASGGTEARRER